MFVEAFYQYWWKTNQQQPETAVKSNIQEQCHILSCLSFYTWLDKTTQPFAARLLPVFLPFKVKGDFSWLLKKFFEALGGQ